MMDFYVILDSSTGRLYRKVSGYDMARYESLSGVRGVVTRLNRKVGSARYSYCSYSEYRLAFPVHMVERTNLMTGQKYMEAEDTPVHMSPAAETYWSR